MTKKKSSENFEARSKFFGNILKKFLGLQRRAAANFYGPARSRRRNDVGAGLYVRQDLAQKDTENGPR